MKSRKMRLEDVDKVLELWCENWELNGDTAPTQSDRVRLKRVLEAYVNHEQVCCYLVEQDQKPVGFVTAFLSSHPVMSGLLGLIEELYVRPAWRGSGVGKDLVDQALTFLREKGAHAFRTHLCGEEEATVSFWLGLGWESDMVTFSLYPDSQ